MTPLLGARSASLGSLPSSLRPRKCSDDGRDDGRDDDGRCDLRRLLRSAPLHGHDDGRDDGLDNRREQGFGIGEFGEPSRNL